MTEEELEKLHIFSSSHKKDLKNSETASCFYCLSTFPVDGIEDFTDKGKTAICPVCDIDAVIPGNKNITKEQLKELQQHYF